ncbi:MAG: DNA mismatch repair endonuclease MutL, partial [Eubacteriales bacterium]|nr:DNA mismatch repair endonuclease MutL [Eubacteriales bacterium]
MEIHVLSQETIGRIAAGEVVERPVNVAKELIENSIDAGATAITVEIRDGGQSLLRVTDNGCGIEPSQIHRAFLRHATSKITDENDLTRLTSLGFRGEALASIAAVAQVEMITKVRESLTGIRAANDGALSLTRNASSENGLYGADDSRFYDLAGGQADSPSDGLSVQEIGAPDGTSVIVRNLFYNVPVRKKFLKQPQTEAGYVTDLIERQALSHPDISFHYRVNGKEKLHTSGNGQLKELIYRIYGRETAAALLPVSYTGEGYTVSGLIGRPEISRASRSFETFFINGRMLRSDILSKALEEGYGTDLMKHCFPFAVLHLTMPPGELDVNVHPTKMEVRFSDPQAVYAALKAAVRQSLHGKELIPAASLLSEREQRQERARREQEAQAADPLRHTEPFEARRETGRSATTPFSAAAPRHTDSQPDP